MLIEFSVQNYLSFKNKVTLSLNSAAIHEFKEDNVFQIGKYRLLKGAAIYGANASGKSNLIKAMAFLRNFVLISAQGMQLEDEIDVQPFMLSSGTEHQPSAFEMIYLIDGTTYRYGIKVSRKSVIAEYLNLIGVSSEKTLFERTQNTITVSHSFQEGKGLEEKTRGNALFLSVAAQFNGDISKKVFDWFYRTMTMSDRGNENSRISKAFMSNKKFNDFLMDFMKSADIGLIGITPKEEVEYFQLHPIVIAKENTAPQYITTRLYAVHNKFNEDNSEAGKVDFDFENCESDGTKKLFQLAGPIFTVLQVGGRLVLDEFDLGLHPILTRAILSLFNSKESNPHNAQLIVTTHDTNLLSAKILRRDQIWFTEKDRYGATDLYSLVEFKEIRNDASFEKDYFQGRYGAIPFLQTASIFDKE